MDIWLLPRARLGELIATLRARGYDLVAPRRRDRALEYGTAASGARVQIALGAEP